MRLPSLSFGACRDSTARNRQKKVVAMTKKASLCVLNDSIDDGRASPRSVKATTDKSAMDFMV